MSKCQILASQLTIHGNVLPTMN